MRATYIHSLNVINVLFEREAQADFFLHPIRFTIPCSAAFWEAARPAQGKLSIPQIKRAVAASVARSILEVCGYERGYNSDPVKAEEEAMLDIMNQIYVRLLADSENTKCTRAEKKYRAAWRKNVVLHSATSS